MQFESEEERNYLVLKLMPKLTRTEAWSLARACADAKELADRLSLYPDFSEACERAEEVLGTCARVGASLITPQSSLYPKALLQIPDPPLVLYTLGDRELLKLPMLALVGARSASVYGLQAAAAVSGILAGAGFCIVSGLARGVDSASHLAALKAGGKTVAVLGTGIDLCYPQENQKLYDRIAEEGLILTEYEPAAKPLAHHFPERNRIISGLSQAVFVVEAGLKSGSLITAEYALENGRDVYCVTGSIFTENNAGAHRLLRDGAEFIGSLEDVKELIRPENRDGLRLSLPAEVLPLEQQLLLDAMSDFGSLPEELAAETQMNLETVQAALTRLQLQGLVRKGPDRKFYPKREIQNG